MPCYICMFACYQAWSKSTSHPQLLLALPLSYLTWIFLRLFFPTPASRLCELHGVWNILLILHDKMPFKLVMINTVVVLLLPIVVVVVVAAEDGKWWWWSYGMIVFSLSLNLLLTFIWCLRNMPSVKFLSPGAEIWSGIWPLVNPSFAIFGIALGMWTATGCSLSQCWA